METFYIKGSCRNEWISNIWNIYPISITMIMKTTTFLGFLKDDSDMDVWYGHSLRWGCILQDLCHDDISLLSGDGAGLVLHHCSSGCISFSQWRSSWSISLRCCMISAQRGSRPSRLLQVNDGQLIFIFFCSSDKVSSISIMDSQCMFVRQLRSSSSIVKGLIQAATKVQSLMMNTMK